MSKSEIIQATAFWLFEQTYCCSIYYWKWKPVARLLQKHLRNLRQNLLSNKKMLRGFFIFFSFVFKTFSVSRNSVADILDIYAEFSGEAVCVFKQLFRDLFAVASKLGSYHCHSLNSVCWRSTFVFKPDVIHYREYSLHRCISVSACQDKFSKKQEILEGMVFFLNYLQFSPIFQWAFCTQNPMTKERRETSSWRQTLSYKYFKVSLFKNKIKINLPSLWFSDCFACY